jgi:hypothetical protein
LRYYNYLFVKKNKVASGDIPDTPFALVEECLNRIRQQHAVKS